MNAAVHRSAIHFLAAHLPGNPAERQKVKALIRGHEAACAGEEGDAPACAPCRYGHHRQRSGACPIRTQAQEGRHG